MEYNTFTKASFRNKYNIPHSVNQSAKRPNLLSMGILSPKESAHSMGKHFRLMLDILGFKTIQHEPLEL